MSAAATPTDDDSGPIVRIHLNLAKAEAAQSSIKMKSEDGGWPVVGYADGIVLKNAHPVIDEGTRQRIAAGASNKTPSAFLEGELVGWTGTPRAEADPKLADRLAPFDVGDMASLEAMTEGTGPTQRIGFNPKKAAQFYPVGAKGPDMGQAVENAGLLVARHWDFQAAGLHTRAMRTDEVEASPLPPTTAERATIQRGVAVTQDYLASLDAAAPAEPAPRRRAAP